MMSGRIFVENLEVFLAQTMTNRGFAQSTLKGLKAFSNIFK